MLLSKILILIIGVAVGILVTLYHRWFVKTIGVNAWAERVFGPAGTYIMYQLAGVLIIIITLIYVTGTITNIADWILGLIGVQIQ